MRAEIAQPTAKTIVTQLQFVLYYNTELTLTLNPNFLILSPMN